MPVERVRGRLHHHRLIRRVLGVRGQMRFLLNVQPRFNYGRDDHLTFFHENGVLFRSPGISLALETRSRSSPTGPECSASSRSIPGRARPSCSSRCRRPTSPARYSEEETREAFENTVSYWRGWLAQSRYQGRWREMVHRSALTLKLLTYEPTGAIVAAPTTSLPERIGGARNWDYRYTWIRDAAFSVYALLRLGFTEEAAAFMGWLTQRFQEARPGTSDPSAGPVRHPRRVRPEGADAPPPGGLPRLRSGEDRQRRRRSAPARHLRRADRLGVSPRQIRIADRSRRLVGSVHGSSTGSRATGTRPTRVSGRCAAAAITSPTRA